MTKITKCQSLRGRLCYENDAELRGGISYYCRVFVYNRVRVRSAGRVPVQSFKSAGVPETLLEQPIMTANAITMS